MATVTFGVATWTTTAGNKTGILTPAVGDLLVVVCANSGRTTAQAPTVTDNNSSGTYTQVKAATKNTSADSMWVFVRTALIAAASSTTVTFAPNAAADSGGGLVVYRVSGMTLTGASAVNNSGSQDNVASGTPAVPLTRAAYAFDAMIGAVNTTTNGAANSAPPSGWDTEGFDNGYNVPANGLATESRSSGETGSTITFGAAAPSAFCSIVVELDTTGLLPPILVMPPQRPVS